MLTLEEMPDYRADLASVQVAFPSLNDSETALHSEYEDDLLDYLGREVGDIQSSELHFLRSAQILEAKFWIWKFVDSSGVPYYASVTQRERCGPVFQCEIQDGLTPEQSMLADYHACY